jgi:regulator of protease activity HflC (stomatin/prohibitin superfamily)
MYPQLALFTTIVGVIFVAIFFNQLYFTVKPGYTAVLFEFGKQLGGTYSSGLHLKSPWKSVVEMQHTLQEDETTGVDCQSNDAVKVQFNVKVENQLNQSCVEYILRDFGPDYDRRLIHDSVRTNMAQRCGGNSIWTIYNEEFHKMDDYIKEDIQKDLELRKIPHECITIHKVKIVKTENGLPKHITEQYTEKAKKKSDIEYSLLKRNETLTLAETDKQKELADLEKQRAVNEARARNDKESQLAELEKQRAVNQKQIEIDEEQARGLQAIAIIKAETNRIEGESEANQTLYKALKHAEGQRQLLTPEYVLVEVARHMYGGNTKIFGSDPTALLSEYMKTMNRLTPQQPSLGNA